MRRVPKSPISGPVASLVDMFQLLLVFVLMMLIVRPEPPTTVILKQSQEAGGAPASSAPLAFIEASAKGIRIDPQTEFISSDEAMAHLETLRSQPGDVLICVRNMDFADHWPLHQLVIDATGQEPYFVPCKKEP